MCINDSWFLVMVIALFTFWLAVWSVAGTLFILGVYELLSYLYRLLFKK